MTLRKKLTILAISTLLLSLVVIGESFIFATVLSRRTHAQVPKTIQGSPQAKKLSFTTPDGFTIAALLINRPHAKRIFLIVHGYNHTKESMSGFIDLFPQDTLFFIDLRGQGESSGHKMYVGLHEHKDVIAAVEYLKNHVSKELPIIGIGISQAARAFCVQPLQVHPFDALVSDSAPGEFKNPVTKVLKRRYGMPRSVGKLSLWFYEKLMGASMYMSDYRSYAHKITCPVLLMHDEQDALISVNDAHKIYQALQTQDKQLHITQGIKHGKMHQTIPQEYKQKVDTFVNKFLKT